MNPPVLPKQPVNGTEVRWFSLDRSDPTVVNVRKSLTAPWVVESVERPDL